MKMKLLFSATLIMFLTSCAALTTTKYDPVIMPESMEMQFGLATRAQLALQFKPYADKKIQSYVSDMGQKMAKVSDRSSLNYEFLVVDSPEINAFAVPGGFIYVTTGLIKYMEDEAQLAAVIGHEIGHVVRKHSVKAIQRQLVAQYGLKYLEDFVAKKSPDKKEIASMASAIGTSFLFAKNSRENEFEADEQGALLASKTGYDPNAMVDVQNLLLKLREGKPTLLEQMLSTHPISEERIKHAGQFIAKQALGGKTRNKEAYAKIKASIK